MLMGITGDLPKYNLNWSDSGTKLAKKAEVTN